MRILPSIAVRMLERVQIRLTRARPGSILVLVVVLIVLLALLGTASLSTTRNDRFTAIQNSANTQVDMIVEGIIEMAKAAIFGDVYGATPTGIEYRPSDDTVVGTGRTNYVHTDGYNLGVVNQTLNGAGVVNVQTVAPHGLRVGDRVAVMGAVPNTFNGEFIVGSAATFTYSFTNAGATGSGSLGTTHRVHDTWLSPRAPMVHPLAGTRIPLWSHIGILPGVESFDTPFTMKRRAGDTGAGLSLTDLGIPTVYTDRVSYTPASGDPVTLTPNYVRPNGASSAGFPAFVVSDPRGLPQGRFVLAADADGDGIADSGFFKVPLGEVDGVTYFAAVRIIDNNSAVNVNTAFSRTSDFDFSNMAVDSLGGTVSNPTLHNNLGIFLSHVGLREMMNDPLNEINAVNLYRRNNVAAPSGMPLSDTGVGSMATATPRSDFQFVTQGDALAHQMARRLGNPGFLNAGASYQPFGMADATGLAYHFTLLNRDASPTALESRLLAVTGGTVDSIYESSGNFDANVTTPADLNSSRLSYSASAAGIGAWFDDNFHFEGYNNFAYTLSGQSVAAPNPAVQVNRIPTYQRPIRALLTTHNPVSNQAPWKLLPNPMPVGGSVGSILLSGMADYRNPAATSAIPKTDVNTAPFEELWRAYWCVMGDATAGGTGTPFVGDPNIPTNGPYRGMEFAFKPDPGTNDKVLGTPGTITNDQRMFRSSLRDPGTTQYEYFRNSDMALLRSAIAAVQTLQLRDPKLNDPSVPAIRKSIKLPIYRDNVKLEDAVVTIHGTKAQPFITEIFAWTDTSEENTGQGPGGGRNQIPFVAVELYNPYPYPITLDNRYRVAWANRGTGYLGGGAALIATTLYTFDGTKTIQPNGYMILSNQSFLSFSPPSSGMGGGLGGGTEHVNNVDLHTALEGELLLIRDEVSATTNLSEMVPLDSFDFTGVMGPGAPRYFSWHYARKCGGENRWYCVYPGRYWGNQDKLRHQGTDWMEWTVDPTSNMQQQSLWDLAPETMLQLCTPGVENPTSTFTGGLPIQLANLDFGGPNKPVAGTNKFPFGGFMRNGDILQVPFIAAYTITKDVSGELIDFNSVSMDASFAEDTDSQDDFPDYAAGALPAFPDVRENIGRFSPVVVATNPQIFTYNDLDPNGAYVGSPVAWRYRWATRLFDYLTVQSPDTDYLPNAPNPTSTDPNGYQTVTGVAPVPVDNDGDGIAGEQQDSPLVIPANLGNDASVGIQGLININTAPWKVLAAIPWVPAGTTDRFGFDDENKKFTIGSDPRARDDNEDIARAIVYWRDGMPMTAGDVLPQGPFTTLFDLYKVRVPVSLSDPNGVFVFDAIQKQLMNAATEPDDTEGDFSPYNVNTLAAGDTKDHARYDFEEQYLLLTKVGNLLTTRSDTFTVYIQVQGWRGVGTVRPELVVQRRAAFIQDRSNLTRANSAVLPRVNVPNE